MIIREIIKPTESTLHIDIPTKYINKKLEFILIEVDESVADQQPKTPITASLSGVLKDKKITRDDYREYLNKKYL